MSSAVAMILLVGVLAHPTLQTTVGPSPQEQTLREYTGAYQWGPNAFIYLQVWNEFSGFDKPGQLVAFDESGQIRVLYPTDYDKFFAGPAIAVPKPIESR